ncbi:hypothetical protein [Acidisoma silvae]|uniref:Uncharacterized protein n=1 Tax=Acidisoma silvae TaxID=2802396 RepID=A0A964E0K3_9PROT|nr:hypothetical protein [Acidisoma silvae]MCB8877605.1 hypothetical protein [Acidisoma silvae]
MTRLVACFIDTMRPVTPAEREAWAVFLSLHRDHWRPARTMFRNVFSGVAPAEALLGFQVATCINDQDVTRRLEAVLVGLEKEARS